ncbi:MetQ/NlpA family ABC transporter substrate-binding protein [Paenibacillus hunanensis]|uniref:Lipoprotein n=1 Tax=Paenibacillus hunanensis TaxID=539262 RepID=A0ABU1IZC2_9BACL|nr:MetQ/NlpA family ABC transporter substrate-binding protein [Paenibacillus hunanensis]MCL9661120.1 MetQ/NlpA family ABC transporter substrate-binding protein [Paenibacillus hunanensis]MDR6243687.1 D-methionine transport system substrate-binding protein [Paenibacillus hunanensis]GGJ23970.1 methionine ABC transporter substrate-binding protein [Paenibacillus hunanensis]
MKNKQALWMVLIAMMLFLAACGGKSSSTTNEAASSSEATGTTETTLKVASLIPPMTDMLDIVKPLLKKDGINLEVVVLSDNVQPNDALANKEVDANFFQHVPYMNQYNQSKGANLVAIQPVYDAIYGAYSKKYKSIDELPEGAVIAIANDPSNIGRSLQMLAQAGMIKLKDGVGMNATQADIISNPKNYSFKEVDLLMLARMYDEADLVAMTPAYAKPLNLTPVKDALVTEKADSTFAITLVAREDNKDAEPIQKLKQHLAGPEVKKFLQDNYADIAVPAF